MSLLKTLGIDKYTTRFKQWIRDKFIAKGGLKTINGESIEGDGDIEISGGGSSVNADWNANEGEAGYIENRTHYKHITNAELECREGYDEFEDYFWHEWGGGGYSDSLKIDRFPAEIIIEGGGYRWAVTLGKVNTLATLDAIVMDESVNIAKVYLEEYEGYYYLIISDQGYDNQILDGTLNVTYNEYIPLNENYIPDTIARKSDLEDIGSGSLTAEEVSSTEPTAAFPQVLYTAQSLSEEQKSQARENIGVSEAIESAIASAITNVLNEEV